MVRVGCWTQECSRKASADPGAGLVGGSLVLAQSPQTLWKTVRTLEQAAARHYSRWSGHDVRVRRSGRTGVWAGLDEDGMWMVKVVVEEESRNDR